jgi:outer membrane lipoprotein-sorting protein
MKKRYWAVALGILVMVLSLVSACGGPETTATPTATGTHTPTGTSTATTTPTSHTATTTTTATQPPTTTAGGSSLADLVSKGEAITSIYFEMATSMPGQDAVTVKMWVKNQTKIRAEMTAEGETVIIISDMNEGVMYMYYPSQNMAMKMTTDTGTTFDDPFEDLGDMLDYNPDIVGTETFDGKPCMVVTYDMPGTGTVKAWIWTEYGFPLKIETTTSEGTMTVVFTNMSFDPIDDSMFELPAGVQIMDMTGGIPTIPTE